MNFKLVNIDLLTSFLESLQDAILEKHAGCKLALEDEFDLVVKDSVSEDVKRYKLNTDPHLAASYGFQVRICNEANGHTAGIMGFCKGNFDNPNSQDDLKWGRVDIALVTLRENTADLHKHLRQRKVQIGLNPAYLRMINDGKKYMWINKESGFQYSHWHEDKDFLDIVKTRVEDSKKIQLATGKRREDLLEQPPYCGKNEAAVFIQTNSGKWEEFKNSKVKFPEKMNHKTEEGEEDNKSHVSASDTTEQHIVTFATPEQTIVTSATNEQPTMTSGVATLQNQPKATATMFSYPPPKIGSSYITDINGQRYYPQHNSTYDGATAGLHVLDPPHRGQDVFRNDAPAMHENWGSQDRNQLPRSDGRHNHHWIPRDDLQDADGKDDHYYSKIDYNKVMGTPQHSPLGAIRKRTNNARPTIHVDPNIEQQRDRESLLLNVKKNLNEDLESTRPKPKFIVEDINQRFSDAVRLDAQSEWEKRVRRNRSPSPNINVSPFVQAGIPGLPVRSADFSVGTLSDRNPVLAPGQLMYQENLRQQIQLTMSNLTSTQEKLTNVLQSEGYRVSDDDFEAELYSNRNITASTDPTLLSACYGQRIRIMNDVNQILQDQLKVKKERLQMLLGSTEKRRSSRIKQQGQQRKKRDNEYYYY